MAEKFTAMEWATMEGGHELPVTEEKFSFLNDLAEARMTRNSSDQAKLSYTDCCERLYLIVLSLELLRLFPSTRGYAAGYAKKTTSYGPYQQFRMVGTDLYNFIYFVIGDDKALAKLKDPESAKAVRMRTNLPTMGLNRYLSAVGNNTAIRPTETLIRLEGGLNITNTDYKAIRRNLFNYNSLSTQEKQNTVTRLLLAVRAKLRSSDIIVYIEELARTKDLENARIKDNEPTVSLPDLATPTGPELQYYRYLVGAKGLVGTKKFLDQAKDGKAVPAPYVQAYAPVVKMVDDIVKAGPGFVQMLRALHNRAKKSR